MSEVSETRRSNPALWVIAIALVVIAVVGIGFAVYAVHRHHVREERDKYRAEAGYYCTLTPQAPANAGSGYLQTARYKKCVEDRINQLVKNGG